MNHWAISVPSPTGPPASAMATGVASAAAAAEASTSPGGDAPRNAPGPPSISSAPSTSTSTTRSTPSAPIPARRSHSRRTNSGVRSSSPSGPGRMTTSLSVPGPFANRMPLMLSAGLGRAGARAHDRQRPFGQVGAGDVQPGDAGVAAEPGLLAAGEPACTAGGLLAGLVRGPLPGQVAKHLLVAEGAAGRAALAQTRLLQAADLVLEAGRPHLVGPDIDPAVPLISGGPKPQLHGGPAGRVVRQGRGERAAGELDDLQGPDDPAAVAGQDGGGRGRI